MMPSKKAKLPWSLASKPMAEQVVGIDAVQVGGEARDLQLAEDPWLRWVVEVEDEQRVRLLERHDVAAVAVEAHGGDVFATRDAVHCADAHQVAAFALRQDGDDALGIGVRHATLGGGDAQIAVPPSIENWFSTWPGTTPLPT